MCVRLSRLPNFVPCSDRSFVLATSTGGLSGICATITWMLLQIWYLISALFYIIGCPVDSCAAGVSNAVKNALSSMHGQISDFVTSVRRSFGAQETEMSRRSPDGRANYSSVRRNHPDGDVERGHSINI